MPLELTEVEDSQPFAGILGTTTELKVLEYLISLPSFTFNISELGRAADVSRPIAQRVVETFSKWGILKIASRNGGVNLYRLNADSPHVLAMQRFVYATNDLVFDLGRFLTSQIIVEGQSVSTSVLDIVPETIDLSQVLPIEFDTPAFFPIVAGR